MKAHTANENEEKVISIRQWPSGTRFRGAGEMLRRNVHNLINAPEGGNQWIQIKIREQLEFTEK
jgi:hypothetical protein